MPISALQNILREAGLSACPPFHRDPQFHLAVLAGVVVLAAMYLLIGPAAGGAPPVWSVWFGAVVGWPLLEEVVFRGILQGDLLRTRWGPRPVAGVTAANLVTSLVFVGFHFINHPPLWALSVLFPSLVFGYFRDRTGSIYPGLALHAVYNAGYLLVLH